MGSCPDTDIDPGKFNHKTTNPTLTLTCYQLTVVGLGEG